MAAGRFGKGGKDRMETRTMKIGMIGLSPGNGHPFSFSAIINGYDPFHLQTSGWPQIYRYVRMRDRSEFGFPGARITHAWTPDPHVTRKLCQACLIPYPVNDLHELIDCVDAVIVARDDPESHYPIARPFLEAGIPAFVDKPLTLSAEELEWFEPYLRRGLLMSCSGMRYARELDPVRAGWDAFGEIKLIRGTVVNGWEKYGVHVLEAIESLPIPKPRSVQSLAAGHEAMMLHCGPVTVQIDALGKVPPLFRLDLFGTLKHATVDIVDHFSMFRRMLWRFLRLCREKKAAIPAESTVTIMNVLRAGRLSLASGGRIDL